MPIQSGRPSRGEIEPTRRRLLAALPALSVLIAGSAGAQGIAWPGGARGAVSLTYDDALNSQLDNAVPQLAARGLRGTFFLTEENIGDRLADWQAVARAGHEIADHTVHHPCDLRGYSPARFERLELAPMERFLDQNFGASRLRTFAYPCGYIGMGSGAPADRHARYIRTLSPTISAARTTAGPPNDPARVLAEPLRLQAFEPTEERTDPLLAFRYVREAARRGHWAILVFHEVLPQRVGEGDTSIALHGEILDWIGRQPVWCAPMGAVLGHIRQDA